MRIAMIGQKGVPATYGGIERHVEEIAHRLADRGHQVSVFCRLYYTPAGSQLDGVHLLRRPSIHAKHLDNISHVAWSTFESLFGGFDIVHFHALGPSMFASLPRLMGAKTAVTVHGLDWQREKWGRVASWILKQCESSAARFPNRTIVVSKTLSEYFREHHRCEPVFIPNGTNLPALRRPDKLLSMGLEPGKYVLFVGRLVPEKGVHFLCEAFQGISTDMKLVLAGGGSFSHDYTSQLERYASDRIRFLGYVYGDTLEELYSNAYLVALPSTIEGLSISLLEALSYGRCVLLSDIPENLEVAADCAVFFRSQDVGDLRDKLSTLLDRPDLVRGIESKARAHIAAFYTWDKVTDSTESLYRELIGARPKP